MEIKNEGNKEGGILIFECKLVPDRKNDYFIRDGDLWYESEPQTEGALGISLAENTAYTTIIPYKINVKDDENFTQYKEDIKDTSFELVVSTTPVKKVVDINIDR